MKENDITKSIIGCALRVINTLGTGFLEKVYENAMVVELKKSGLAVDQQKKLAVYYEGEVVGEYSVDLLVERLVLVELKVSREFDENHFAQLMNYLKASNKRLGLLLNFGTPRLGIKRFIL